MSHAEKTLIQDDGIDLTVGELVQCWEVTQDQDTASKIEKALFETQRDVKTEATFMSDVARRELNFQQLGNALGKPLPAVIKGFDRHNGTRNLPNVAATSW